MILNHNTARACIAALLLAGAGACLAAGNMYRYTNDQGNLVMDDHVPPEYVKDGYEVVNPDGVVIEVVPRQLTAEEQKSADAAAAEEKRLREWDTTLLRRYSSVEDIEAARDRTLNDLNIRVSILKSNRRSLKHQVENYQSQAAELERRGQKVDKERLDAISSLQTEIANTEKAIADREQEIAGVTADYAADIERFEQIQDKVEFRRKAAEAGSAK